MRGTGWFAAYFLGLIMENQDRTEWNYNAISCEPVLNRQYVINIEFNKLSDNNDQLGLDPTGLFRLLLDRG